MSIADQLGSVGVDIEDLARWRNPSLNFEGLFTAEELLHARSLGDVSTVLAGLWCAREAALKALHTRWPKLCLRDLAISHDEDGVPFVVATNGIYVEAAARVTVSISRSATHAIAFAIAWNFHPGRKFAPDSEEWPWTS